MSSPERIAAERINRAFQAMRPKLHRYIARMVLRDAVAEELVQEAAVRALQAAERAPRDEAELRPWLFRIATRLAIDERRRHGFQRENLMEDLREQAESTAGFAERVQAFAGTPETAAVAREHLQYCFRCTLQHLSEHQAAALLLKEVMAMSNQEVATVLEQSPTQIKNRVQEARRTMRSYYENRCALAEQRGVCHQCVELDEFFGAGAGDPLRGSDGGVEARLRVLRADEQLPTGVWTKTLETLLDAL